MSGILSDADRIWRVKYFSLPLTIERQRRIHPCRIAGLVGL
jgi:hypothetical protein